MLARQVFNPLKQQGMNGHAFLTSVNHHKHSEFINKHVNKPLNITFCNLYNVNTVK